MFISSSAVATRRGQHLRIHPVYLRQGVRRRSQDLATQALRYRSEREMVQARGQSIERLHCTEVDWALIRAPMGCFEWVGRHL